jgi:hypothetical protein
MRYAGFVGPTTTLVSKNQNFERTINFYAEPGDAGVPKSSGMLIGRPSVYPHLNIGISPIRAAFAQDGRCFFVAGVLFVEVFASQTGIVRGQVVLDGNPATISTNGTGGFQLFITSGGHGYIFDLRTNTLTEITDPGFPTPVLMGGFSDGYFVALKSQSSQFNLSALEDGTDWNALDVGQVSESSNIIRAMIVSHREIVLLGSRTTEIWADIGASNFPYAPIPGTQVQQGITAPWSAQRLGGTVFWIGENEDGNNVVYRFDGQGYSPVRISTFGVEAWLNALPRTDDAIAWTMQWHGHPFYFLYLPQADKVPAQGTQYGYDIASNSWVEWAHWNETRMDWDPFLARCHCFAFNKHLLGDRQSGNVYQLRDDIYKDFFNVP